MKICSNCNLPKDILEFYKDKQKKDGLTSRCKFCITNNIDNKSRKEYAKLYYNNNTISVSKKSSEYRINNKDKCNTYQREYYHSNRKNNSNYKLISSLRAGMYDLVKHNKNHKHTLELLECSIDEFKIHLQQTAIANGYIDFDIDNYSGQDFHIDHIIPLNAVELGTHSLEQIQHYTNFQILKAKINLSKGCKY